MPFDQYIPDDQWIDDRSAWQEVHDRFASDMDDALAEIAWREDRRPRVCSVCGGRGWLMVTDSHRPWVEIPTECVDCP